MPAGVALLAGTFEENLNEAAGAGRALLAAWPLLLAAFVLLAGAGLVVALHRRRQEERFHSLFEAAPGPLLLLDGDRRVVEVNAAASELLGRSAPVLRGQRLDGFLDAAGADPPTAAFEALEDAAPEAFEEEDIEHTADARLERPDGTVRQVRLRLRPLALDGRRFTAAALQDMTAVSEEQSFFKSFHRRTMQDLPVELAVLTPEGTYLYANPLACTDQVAPGWLQGKTDFDLCRRLGLHPEVALRRRSHRRRALQRGKRVQFQEVLSRRDAPPRHVKRFYTPIFREDAKADDEAHAVVTYAMDQTRLRKRENALEKAERASKDVEEMKATLLRNLRHEFRTPLTSILSAAEVLEDEASQDQQEFVGIVRQNGQRLLRTLNAMLDLAGLQTGSLNQRPRVLDLGAAVEDVIGELEETAAEKGLFLRKQALALETLVRVDPASLYRILRSVIGNAVKFTEEGGIVVEVEAEDGQAEVRVIDTGVGIETDYLPQLFDSFEQESDGLTRQFEGTGVGLAVARRLLRLMGGAISVDSEKGEGSVFTITVPMAFRGPEGERSAVLVVEEQGEQERLLRHRLEEHVRLTVARSLDEALNAAQRERFGAVLVNAGLSPDAAAGDFVQRFRALDGYEHASLIVIDDHALPGAAEQFEAAGYDGYVARPLQREALLNALGNALEAPAALVPSPKGAASEAAAVPAGLELSG